MTLIKRYSVNPKTVEKWRKRDFVHDAPMGPKVIRSRSLNQVEEAAIVAFLTSRNCPRMIVYILCKTRYRTPPAPVPTAAYSATGCQGCQKRR